MASHEETGVRRHCREETGVPLLGTTGQLRLRPFELGSRKRKEAGAGGVCLVLGA